MILPVETAELCYSAADHLINPPTKYQPVSDVFKVESELYKLAEQTLAYENRAKPQWQVPARNAVFSTC
jgi:hypothetical protein